MPLKKQTTEQEGKTSPIWGVVTMGGGKIRKVWGRLNVVEILCTHVWKWKNETCWNNSRNGEGGIKEE
jgi:hypothetical protein